MQLDFAEIASPPSGSFWVTNCVYVELFSEDELTPEWRRPEPSEPLLQVLLQNVTRRNQPDAAVYLLKETALRLLHIPPHIFSVLAAHAQHHHVDRHFATHVVSYRLSADVHLLVNAHPIFADAAFAAGCINEPPEDEEPSMEMRIAKLRPRPRREQIDPSALEHWAAFAREFPEVTKRHIYFISQKQCFHPGEELTASYGSGYHRMYSAHGFAEPPPSARVPVDAFRPSDLAKLCWPVSVPGWWNPDMQPIERPALQRRSRAIASDAICSTYSETNTDGSSRDEVSNHEVCHEVVLVPDDPMVVLTRQHLPLE